MKIKPVYIYVISFVVIVILLVVFTSGGDGTSLPTEEVNPHSQLPDDEIHRNLEGDSPMSGNVSESFRQKMNQLKEGYESNPSDTVNAKEYARMLAAAHQPENAVEIYKGILSRDKNRFDIRFELATVYYNMRQYENAKDEIQKVLEVDNDNLDAKYNLGAIEAAMGNTDKAKEIWNQLVNQYPDSEAARVAEQSLKNLEQM